VDVDLRNVDPRPEEFEMFSHLLWFVLGVEDCEFSEDAHVSTLQTCHSTAHAPGLNHLNSTRSSVEIILTAHGPVLAHLNSTRSSVEIILTAHAPALAHLNSTRSSVKSS